MCNGYFCIGVLVESISLLYGSYGDLSADIVNYDFELFYVESKTGFI